jgi:hypothetical protein
VQFAAAIPAHWGDDDLAELIFLPLEKRENRSYPTWEWVCHAFQVLEA